MIQIYDEALKNYEFRVEPEITNAKVAHVRQMATQFKTNRIIAMHTGISKDKIRWIRNRPVAFEVHANTGILKRLFYDKTNLCDRWKLDIFDFSVLIRGTSIADDIFAFRQQEDRPWIYSFPWGRLRIRNSAEAVFASYLDYRKELGKVHSWQYEPEIKGAYGKLRGWKPHFKYVKNDREGTHVYVILCLEDDKLIKIKCDYVKWAFPSSQVEVVTKEWFLHNKPNFRRWYDPHLFREGPDMFWLPKRMSPKSVRFKALSQSAVTLLAS